MQNILKNSVNFLVADISTNTTSSNGLEITVTTIIICSKKCEQGWTALSVKQQPITCIS
jgi:hypothetical protein